MTNGDSKKIETLMKAAIKNSPKINSTSATFSKTNGNTNKDASGKFFLMLGFMSWFAIWGSSYVMSLMLKERELRVTKRISLTNTSSMVYFISKLILSLIIGIIQVALMMLSFKYIVHTDSFIDIWTLGALLFGFIVVAICINLAIVSFSSNEQQVNTLSIIVVNITAMFSGSYWSFDIMPQWMKNLSYFTPQRWIIYTMKQMANNVDYALLTYGAVILGFVIFLSALSLLGFKFKASTNS